MDQYSGEKRKRDNEEDGSRRPRPSSSRQTLARLSRTIVEIGEPSRYSLTETVANLAHGLSSIEEDDVRGGVLSTIVALVSEQPQKVSLLSAAIQVANSSTPKFGQMVVELVHTKIEQFISEGDWTRVKNFVRFLCTLAPIVDGTGIKDFLLDLVNRAVQIQQNNSERDGLAEELYIIVLLALPYYVKAGEDDSGKLDEGRVADSEDIIRASREFEIKPQDEQTKILAPFMALREDQQVPFDSERFVVLVQAALARVVEDQWLVPNLMNTSTLVRKATGGREVAREEGESLYHVFPAVKMPEELEGQAQFRYPEYYFRAYLPTTLETVPAPDTYEAVLLRDVGSELIDKMDFNRREVTRQLITLDLFFASSAFADPGIPLDQLQDPKYQEEGRSTWKVEDVAIEAVLDHLFRLPSTAHPQVYYHTILTEACSMAPKAVAPVFGRAVRFLYANIDTMDVELFYRFVDWFSHHLSNFGFTWKWNEWVDDLELPDRHPKKVFIRELIENEVRLSYFKRIHETLPEQFLPLLRDVPEEPSLEYLEEGNPYNELVQNLITKLRSNTTATAPNANNDQTSTASGLPQRENASKTDGLSDEEQGVLLEEIKDKVTSESVGGRADDLDEKETLLLVATICHLGSRSLSHAKDWISQTKGLLTKFIADAEERKNHVITAVLHYWRDQPMVGLHVLGFFVEEGIVPESLLVRRIVESDDILLTSHGWSQLVYIVNGADSETRAAYVAMALTSISNKLSSLPDGTDEESNGWMNWWYAMYARSLCRKYHSDLGSSEGLSEQVQQFFDQARTL